MTLWPAFRRLLATLAVISLALAPTTAPAVAGSEPASMVAMIDQAAGAADQAADGTVAMAMDEMPCCPPVQPMTPDCQKGCPLAALCLVKVPPALAESVSVPLRVVNRSPLVWTDEAAFSSIAQAPLPEPPRS
jgi:hypothetical protein